MHQPIDTAALKRAHPIERVVAGYGIALRRSGRALVGRCPFHDDHGRPNLYVYATPDPARDGYCCYRCGAHGDAIDFVARIDGVGFLAAAERLAGGRPSAWGAPRRDRAPVLPAPRPIAPSARGPAERACLTAAVELYASRLASAPAALAYLRGRGLDRGTLERHRIGYVTGGELAAYLAWRRLPLAAARRVGLLGRDGREHLAGRVVVPEIRAGQPIWLVGRAIAPAPPGPTYLGLPGRKPLLGWEAARGSPAAWVVEGVVDWLVLRMWRLPALCLLGTRPRPAVVAALQRVPRLLLALDADAAGRAATAALLQALGDRARAVEMPGVADPAELALVPGGRRLLLRAADRARLARAA